MLTLVDTTIRAHKVRVVWIQRDTGSLTWNHVTRVYFTTPFRDAPLPSINISQVILANSPRNGPPVCLMVSYWATTAALIGCTQGQSCKPYSFSSATSSDSTYGLLSISTPAQGLVTQAFATGGNLAWTQPTVTATVQGPVTVRFVGAQSVSSGSDCAPHVDDFNATIVPASIGNDVTTTILPASTSTQTSYTTTYTPTVTPLATETDTATSIITEASTFTITTGSTRTVPATSTTVTATSTTLPLSFTTTSPTPTTQTTTTPPAVTRPQPPLSQPHLVNAVYARSDQYANKREHLDRYATFGNDPFDDPGRSRQANVRRARKGLRPVSGSMLSCLLPGTVTRTTSVTDSPTPCPSQVLNMDPQCKLVQNLGQIVSQLTKLRKAYEVVIMCGNRVVFP